MGSFPSQEQAVYPSGAPSDTDIATATHQHHVRMRTRHTLIKKLTRGKLLFLGLDGAGKSTIIHHLIRSLDEERININSTSTAGDTMGGSDDHRGFRVYPNPSKVHQSWSYRLEGDCYLQILDVPGRHEFRRKWYTTALAPSDSSTLYSSVPGSGGGSSQTLPLLGIVFVVDASDRVRFPIVAEELIRFQKLKEQKKMFQRAQFFLLLNKTDQTAPKATDSQTSSEQQKQANEADRRAAMRFARRELKKCVDHQLRVDQKRNPHDYRHPPSLPPALSNSFSLSASSTGPEIPLGAPPDMKSPKAQFAGSNRNGTLTAEASATRTTTMMTSILECNAHDRESIKAIHAWIKEETKKAMQ